VFAFGESGT